MRRKLYDTIKPGDGNAQNRLLVKVFDMIDEQYDMIVGVGYAIETKDPRTGRVTWINTHPREIDELVEMLKEAKRAGKERLAELCLTEWS